MKTYPSSCVLSYSLQRVWTLKGQFSLNLETLEIDSSQSALLVRGANTALKCSVEDFGHQLPSSVRQPKIVASWKDSELTTCWKKHSRVGSVRIIMNRGS